VKTAEPSTFGHHCSRRGPMLDQSFIRHACSGTRSYVRPAPVDPPQATGAWPQAPSIKAARTGLLFLERYDAPVVVAEERDLVTPRIRECVSTRRAKSVLGLADDRDQSLTLATMKSVPPSRYS
jgi:hypothetical protein